MSRVLTLRSLFSPWGPLTSCLPSCRGKQASTTRLFISLTTPTSRILFRGCQIVRGFRITLSGLATSYGVLNRICQTICDLWAPVKNSSRSFMMYLEHLWNLKLFLFSNRNKYPTCHHSRRIFLTRRNPGLEESVYDCTRTVASKWCDPKTLEASSSFSHRLPRCLRMRCK